MPDIRNDLKQRIKQTHHSVADLFRSSKGQLRYQRVSGFLNGRCDLSRDQDRLLRKIISDWENDYTSNPKYKNPDKRCKFPFSPKAFGYCWSYANHMDGHPFFKDVEKNCKGCEYWKEERNL